jgi:MFS superfamily sulfate permease-like transporter
MSISKTTPPEVGSYTGALVTVVTSLTLTQFGVIVGIFTALLTFLLNAWYTRERNTREREQNAREHLLADLERREREFRLAQFLAQLQAPESKPHLPIQEKP